MYVHTTYVVCMYPVDDRIEPKGSPVVGWDLQAYHSLIRTYICTWGSVGLVCKPPVIVHFNPEAGVQDLQESEAQSSPNLEILIGAQCTERVNMPRTVGRCHFGQALGWLQGSAESYPANTPS